jgi:hypothetical protein
MPVDKTAALADMNEARNRYNAHCAKYRSGRPDDIPGAARMLKDSAEVFTALKTAIYRNSPAGSVYRMPFGNEETIHSLAGTLATLFADWNTGRLQAFEEIVHGQTFSDFLEMAEHLLKEGYKDAAAVIAGGTLEQHLRALCTKHGVMPIPENLNKLNADLYRQPPGAYDANNMKLIIAWAETRNNAAHGHYDKVDPKQVDLMIQGIRQFISAYPA